MTQEIFERRNSPVQIIFRAHTSSFFKFKRLPWQEETGVDKVVVQPYLLLVEASESFEKAELAAKEAPTETLERAATVPSRKTVIPIGARENPDGSESNQDEGATKQYRVASSVLDEPWCVHHGAMVSWFVWLFMYIFIT
jgi:hypothetical protein